MAGVGAALDAVHGNFEPLAIGVIYRGIRAMLDRCSMKCSPFGPNFSKRQACMLICKQSALNNAISKLKSELNKCDDSECRKEIEDHISKINYKLRKLKSYELEFDSDEYERGKEHYESKED